MTRSTGFLIGAVFIALASIPLILKMVPRNPIYGFRTPSTLTNDDLWFRANHFAGWAFLIAAVFSAVMLAIVHSEVRATPTYDIVIFAVPLVVATVASFVYLRRINKEVVADRK